MTLPRVSREARCPDCGRPVVVPSIVTGETWTFPCCTGIVTASIKRVEKARPKSKPRKALRRRPKPKRTELARRLSDRWAKTFRALSCASCGAVTDFPRGIIVEGHHIVRQALIRERGKAEGWAEEELARRLWDLRNGLPLCSTCHANHHSGMKRLAWSLVLRHAAKVEQFAREVELTRRARREYA